MKDTIIIDDPIQTFHCTIIRRKKNKALAGREFEFENCSKDDALIRIKAYYIREGIFGELDDKTSNYFGKVYCGKAKPIKEYQEFFNQFDRLFRCII